MEKVVLEGELELWTQEGGFAGHEAIVDDRDLADTLAGLFGVANTDGFAGHSLDRQGKVGKVRITIEVLEIYEEEK